MKLKKIKIFLIIFIIISSLIIMPISMAQESYENKTTISVLSENFWNSDNVAIGVFFSSKYYRKEDGTVEKNVDDSLGLYITNNGKDFVYIGETGITGRDPNIMYKDGVFYMATTKGGDSKGRVVVNIFKTTDLINWTNIQNGIEKDEEGDTVYRYSLGIVEENKYHLTTNTWSPKWFTDGEKSYLLVSSSRFTEDGEILYYMDSTKEVLVNNNLTTNNNYSELNLDAKKGVLVKEYAALDSNGNVIYNAKGEIITNKEFYKDSKGKLVQAKCPFYTNNKYPLLDTYIAEVTNFGNIEEKTDVNIKNIKFGKIQKLQFNGFAEQSSNHTKSLYYLHRSMLGGYMLKNKDNSEYKYTLYTKTDPYGTVQRWVSNNFIGPWNQVDDAFYVGNSVNEKNITCTATTTLTSHYDRLPGNISINSSYDDKKVYDKHFEGSFINSFGNDTLFYSDHYVVSTQEVGKSTDENYIENINSTLGIYYSVLQPNKENGTVDFGYTDDHIRFSTYTRVNVLNDNMKISKLQGSHLRNGTVYTVNQAVTENSQIDINNLKSIIKQAKDFNVNVKAYKQQDGSTLCILKSNRTINNKENNGWKYISQIWTDESVDINTRNIYSTYYENKKTTPYCANNTYLYKVFKNDREFEEISNISIYDMLDNEKEIIFRTQNEEERQEENQVQENKIENTEQEYKDTKEKHENTEQEYEDTQDNHEKNYYENINKETEENKQESNKESIKEQDLSKSETINIIPSFENIKIITEDEIEVLENEEKIIEDEINEKIIIEEELKQEVKEQIEQEKIAEKNEYNNTEYYYDEEEKLKEEKIHIEDLDKRENAMVIPQTGVVETITIIVIIIGLIIIAILSYIGYRKIK